MNLEQSGLYNGLTFWLLFITLEVAGIYGGSKM